MANAIDKLDFTIEDGAVRNHDLSLYALSTCAFCKRAIEFLKSRDVAFRYIYLDQISLNVKASVKAELKSKYDNIPVFPILVIDNAHALSGFNEERWKTELGLNSD